MHGEAVAMQHNSLILYTGHNRSPGNIHYLAIAGMIMGLKTLGKQPQSGTHTHTQHQICTTHNHTTHLTQTPNMQLCK